MPYIDSLDLANRACQHVGNPQILTIDEDSRANFELAFAYDKLRCAELRRNTWRFATKTVVLRSIQTSTRLLRPALWSATTLYLPGAIVRDENGEFWHSSTPENVNNIPGQSLAWDQYFGPATVDVWSADSSYYAGELAYVLGENSSYVVYLSLTNSNTAVPGTAQAYGAAVTYNMNDVVSHDGYLWRSLLAFNLNNTPATGPALWDANASYGTLFLVTAQDGYTYASTGENNVGFDPATDAGAHWTRIGVNAWSRLPALYPSDRNWLPIYGSLDEFYLTSPIGYGPDLGAGQRSLYRLPWNYLRECPRDPKAGSVTMFGAGTGMNYNDWIFQGDYLITSDTGPLMFRFVADVTVVARMDDMFCEALAARMALAACEPLAASSSKKRDIANEYSRWVAEARLVNGIEIGAEEPPEDDWLACRA
jgi:hypothetical protein